MAEEGEEARRANAEIRSIGAARARLVRYIQALETPTLPSELRHYFDTYRVFYLERARASLARIDASAEPSQTAYEMAVMRTEEKHLFFQIHHSGDPEVDTKAASELSPGKSLFYGKLTIEKLEHAFQHGIYFQHVFPAEINRALAAALRREGLVAAFIVDQVVNKVNSLLTEPDVAALAKVHGALMQWYCYLNAPDYRALSHFWPDEQEFKQVRKAYTRDRQKLFRQGGIEVQVSFNRVSLRPELEKPISLDTKEDRNHEEGQTSGHDLNHTNSSHVALTVVGQGHLAKTTKRQRNRYGL
ncbi:hypothetical protein OIV83_005655 [Microbotryomycetes sp. JL201]|nr:hypothetical protein OIV83_005655 [Microbotryomycetes sp. JL201]